MHSVCNKIMTFQLRRSIRSMLQSLPSSIRFLRLEYSVLCTATRVSKWLSMVRRGVLGQQNGCHNAPKWPCFSSNLRGRFSANCILVSKVLSLKCKCEVPFIGFPVLTSLDFESKPAIGGAWSIWLHARQNLWRRNMLSIKISSLIRRVHKKSDQSPISGLSDPQIVQLFWEWDTSVKGAGKGRPKSKFYIGLGN